MSRILVTGANGFVGRVLCRTLLDAGHAVTGLVRRRGSCIDDVFEWVHEVEDFAGVADSCPTELEIDCAVLLAARVHVMHDAGSLASLDAFRETNVEGALRVAQAAQRMGVRRIVFVSSIKAVAELDSGRPLRESDPKAPEDAYGVSKLEAEKAIRQFGRKHGIETVIVRPPLVYGPQVRANFLRLMNAVAKGIPLPLGSVKAKRSLIYVNNLAHALSCCAIDPRAAEECFHVADRQDTSIPDLVRDIARHLRRPARLIALPVRWLRISGRLTGRSPQIERLVCDLRVDSSRIREVLDWQPPYSLDDGLAATVRWYQSSRRDGDV